ncbi:hypothetical protein CARUB_v10015840mg [Capsella rubella]|uniref:F-box domain-containing protein n=1 Tax=Capsella rubella TaxID=81985 RepID=R0GAH8_9BRAS|nr:hypothetical protein CARUB_v10015840mg [Capsella rubella]
MTFALGNLYEESAALLNITNRTAKLSRVPPKVLVRFRAVSKQWNALFDDKRFLNNHKMTFRFIIATKCKIYSVSIDPVIVVRELPLGTPGLESLQLITLIDCNDLLLCGKERGAVVWNPWKEYHTNDLWTTYDFSSDVWIDHKSKTGNDSSSSIESVSVETAVSLNGTLYWVCFSNKNDPLCYNISKFDFSSETWDTFCNLPCGRNHDGDALVLRVFMGDLFSLLKQCIVTKKIDIWVTENKIYSEDGGGVVWKNFMTLSDPNLPDLVETVRYYQPSYFIEGKRLVVCSCDNTGQAWIYILGDNELISKTRIDDMVRRWPLHCTFIPSLVQVPD